MASPVILGIFLDFLVVLSSEEQLPASSTFVSFRQLLLEANFRSSDLFLASPLPPPTQAIQLHRSFLRLSQRVQVCRKCSLDMGSVF